MCDVHLAKKYVAKAQSSASRGIAFELSFTSYKNLMRAKKCYYTGIILTDPVGGKALNQTDRTIDSIDNTKGYVSGNVVACCWAANQLKSFTEDPGNIVSVKFIERMLKKMV